jgi:hypothetical protein
MVAFGVSVIENREGAVRKKENGERREVAGEKKKKNRGRKRRVGSTQPGILSETLPGFLEIIGPGQPGPCPF